MNRAIHSIASCYLHNTSSGIASLNTPIILKKIAMNNSTIAVNGKRLLKRSATLMLVFALLFVANVSKAQVIVETFEEPSFTSIAAAGNNGASATSNGTLAVTLLTSNTTNTNSNGTQAATFSSINQIVVTVNPTSTATSQAISTLTANGSNSTVASTTNAAASVGTWTWWVWGAAAIVQNPNYNAGGGATSPHSLRTCARVNGGYLATPIIPSGVSQVTFWVYANSNFYVGVKSTFAGFKTFGGATSAGNMAAMPSATSGNTNTNPYNVYNQFGNNVTNFACTAGAGKNVVQMTYTIPASLASKTLQLAFWGGSNGVSIDDIVITSPLLGQTFYSQSSSDLSVASNWNTNRTGGGTAATTADFTTANNVFVVQGAVASGGGGASNHSMTVGNAITIGGGAGINTKLEIEGGASVTAGNAITFGSNGIFQIDANGTYTQANSSGFASTILAGVENFAATSNFIVTSSAGTGPGTPTTGFGNLTFSATGSNVNSSGALNDGASSTGKAIQGNLTISGSGAYRFTGSTAVTASIGGNLTIQSGGTLDIANSTSSPIINVGGNLSIDATSTLDAISGTTATVNFNKSGLQTFTQTTGGVIAAPTSSSNSISFVVLSGSILNMGTSVLSSAATSTINFTVNSGATLITANSGGITSANTASGSIQNLAGSRTYNAGANYIFDASGAQATGTGLTGAVNLITGKDATVTQSSNVAVTGTATIAGGFDFGTNALTGSGGVFTLLGNTTTASTNSTWTSGASSVTVTSASGISPGMLVSTVTGIPSNTYVTSVSGTTVNLSNYTTAAGTAVGLTFASAGALTTANLASGGAFTSTGGTGSVQVTGTRTYASTADYTFDGASSAQVAGNQFIAARNITLNNSGGLTLSAAVSASGTVTLTSGALTTTSSNLLSVTNTATTAISGSSSGYIDGPVKWSLLNSRTNTYAFPLGNGGTYLPLSLASTNTTSGNTATAQAFSGNSGGSADNTTLQAISTTEYWNLVTSASLATTGSTITISRPTAISPFNIVGYSSTSGGTYVSLNGTSSTSSATSGDIGTGTFSGYLLFATISQAPTVVTTAATSSTITTTGATLNGTVNARGFTATPYFEYGTTASLGTNVTALPTSITGSTDIADSVVLTGLASNTKYFYRDSATNVNGNRAGSTFTVTTLSNAPTIGTASSPTSSGFTANWTAPSNGGSESITYTVDVSTDNTFATGVTEFTGISGTSTVLNTLSPSTNYYYRVKAVNAGGSSVWSATSSVVLTNDADTDGSAPSVGNNINSTADQFTILSRQRSRYLVDDGVSNTVNGFAAITLKYDNGGTQPPFTGQGIDTKYAWYIVNQGGSNYSLQNVSTGRYLIDGGGTPGDGYVGFVGGNCDGSTRNWNTISLVDATTFNGISNTNKKYFTRSSPNAGYFEFASLYGSTDGNYSGYFVNTDYTGTNNGNNSTNVLVSGAANNATNSCFPRDFGLTQYIAAADLTISFTTSGITSNNVFLGSSFTVTPTITNNNKLAIANGTAIKVKFTFNGKVVTASYTGGLAANGGSTTLSAMTITPGTLTAGSTLTGTVNSNWAIAETNYSNNTSSVANITVTCPTPSISSQPPSTPVVCGGSDLNIPVAVTPITGATLTYQWQVSTDNGSTWNNTTDGVSGSDYYTGSTTNTLTIHNASAASNNNQYQAIITSTITGYCSNSTTSNAATVTVSAPSAPTSGGNVTVTYDGSPHNVSATAGGGEAIDWYDAATGGTLLLSNNTNSPTATAAGVYNYYAQARNISAGCLSPTRTLITLTINQASLTITADDTSKVYGAALTSGTGYTNFTSSGLVNGETIGTVTLTYGTGGAATDAVGTYSGQVTPSAATGGTFTSSNYNINYVSGAITVNPAVITITARDTSKTYGVVLASGAGYSNYTVTSGSLQNGETPTVTLTYGTGGAGTDAVGTYSGQITPSAATGGGFNASNYTITYANGTITVTPATLTLTANTVNKNYGDVLNGGTGYTAFTPSGLQNGETVGSVTFIPGSGKNASDPPGTYANQAVISTVVGGTFDPSNYTVTYVPGDIVVSSVTAYWHSVGSSTDWSDPANWTNGIVPDQYKSAVVKTDSVPYPILTQDGTVYGLDLQGDATVGVDQFTLNIYGPVSSGTGTISGSSAAVFDAQVSAGSVVIAGAAGNLKFTDGAQMLYNLTLLDNASATLATPLVIAAGTFSNAGSLNIGNSATLNTGDGLTLKSDDFNTAQVGTVGTSGAINGNVTVERYIRSFFNPPYESDINNVTGPAKRAWRMMTAPISGTQTIFDAWQNGAPSTYIPGIGTFITGQNANQAVNGLDGGLTGLNGSYSLKAFDTTGTGSLVNVDNTKVPISGNTGSADNKPYFIFIRGDRDSLTTGNPQFGGLDINNTTLTATGKLQIGTQTFNIQASPDLENGDLQYSMIGNPYMSPVDLNLLTYNNVAPFVYTWDPGLNQVGAYVTLFGGPGQNDFTVSTPSDGSTFQDNFIQSSQAFLVYGGTDAGSSSVVFTEGSKATTNNNKVFRPATGATTFRTNLYLLNADNSFKLADGCLAQYDNAYCSCVDIYDAPKLPNINEQIGLMRGTHLLSIESRPIITTPDTLFLNLQKTTQRNYTYHFYPVSMAQPGMQAFLMDSYLADSTELSLTDSTVVNFSINADVASQATNRFMVVFRPSGVVPVTYTNVKAYQQSADIAVQWSVTNQQNIKEYVVEKSVDGTTWTTVATVTGNTSNTYDWLDANAVSGDNYYRIRSVGTNGAIQYSTVVKVNIGATAPAIAVYPNPIRGGVIGLQMTNMAKGKYGIRLIDNIGRVLMSTEIQHAGGSANQSIHYDNNLAKGVYHIEVNGPNNYKNDIKVMN